jgi:hypothetical protein
MGMTKRSEKAKAQQDMQVQADGYTAIQFQHPRLRREAMADRGHMRMTPAEYAKHRLGHGRTQSQETARFKHDERTRYPRKITKK